MWVLLKTLKNIEVQGRMRTYHPGDWVNVGKQTALLWISQGDAEVPEGRASDLMGSDCGVWVLGGANRGQTALGDYVGKIDASYHADIPQRLPWSKTLVYNPTLRLRKELVPVGFHLLDTWQIALPLWDYEKLALDQGEPQDFERTKALIHDLRVPLYSPDLVFLRRCGDSDAFLQAWLEERAHGGDGRHAILRALYRAKPLVLALPTTWIGKDRGL